MLRARSGAVAVLTAVITLVLGVGSSFAAYRVALSGVEVNAAVGRFLLSPLSQFRWPFVRGAEVSDYVAFGAGVLILVAIAALLALIGARSASFRYGGSAVFLATWMSVILAAVLSKAVFLLLTQSRILGDSPTDDLLVNFYYGGVLTSIYWGLLVGWLPALIGAIAFKVANRRLARAGDEASDDDGWPLTETPSSAPAPPVPPGFTYPPGNSFEEHPPFGASNAYDAGTPQGSRLFTPETRSDRESPEPTYSGASAGRDDKSDQTQQIPRNTTY